MIKVVVFVITVKRVKHLQSFICRPTSFRRGRSGSLIGGSPPPTPRNLHYAHRPVHNFHRCFCFVVCLFVVIILSVVFASVCFVVVNIKFKTTELKHINQHTHLL